MSMNVAVFGSNNITVMPCTMRNDIEALHRIYGSELRIIVSDSQGFSREVHKIISAVGLIEQSVIYCLDECRYNLFELPVEIFTSQVEGTEGTESAKIIRKSTGEEIWSRCNLDNSKAYEAFKRELQGFRNRMICNDADCALVAWDGDSKSIMKSVDIFKAQNKPVKIYRC